MDGTPPPSGKQTIGTKFNLVANVCHTGTPEAGKYVCHVLHRATDEWYTVDVSPANAASQPASSRDALATR